VFVAGIMVLELGLRPGTCGPRSRSPSTSRSAFGIAAVGRA